MWVKLLKDIGNPDTSAMLDSLLSPYEKQIIVNRLAALILIRDGKTYKQIGEELWLSPSTIRSLKKTIEDKSVKEYQSYRLTSNKRKKENREKELAEAEKIIERQRQTPDWIHWLDRMEKNFPKKHGPRWKWVR